MKTCNVHIVHVCRGKLLPDLSNKIQNELNIISFAGLKVDIPDNTRCNTPDLNVTGWHGFYHRLSYPSGATIMQASPRKLPRRLVFPWPPPPSMNYLLFVLESYFHTMKIKDNWNFFPRLNFWDSNLRYPVISRWFLRPGVGEREHNIFTVHICINREEYHANYLDVHF